MPLGDEDYFQGPKAHRGYQVYDPPLYNGPGGGGFTPPPPGPDLTVASYPARGLGPPAGPLSPYGPRRRRLLNRQTRNRSAVFSALSGSGPSLAPAAPIGAPAAPGGAGQPAFDLGGFGNGWNSGGSFNKRNGIGGAGQPAFDPYDPLGYLNKVPGISNLLDPNGDSGLYSALYQQGIAQSGTAVDRSILASRARGIGGLPYGVAAQEAERGALSDTSNSLLNARADSINRNRQFAGSVATGYQDYLRQLYREREAQTFQAQQAELQRRFEAKYRKRKK